MFFHRKKLKKSTPEEDRNFRERLHENGVGFSDTFAMIVAAFFTIVLPCAIILVVICLLGMLLFGVWS